MQPNLNVKNPVAETKKAWNDGPHLIFISQNTVSGGGTHTHTKEIAGPYGGFPHAIQTSHGSKIGATINVYNLYHS